MIYLITADCAKKYLQYFLRYAIKHAACALTIQKGKEVQNDTNKTKTKNKSAACKSAHDYDFDRLRKQLSDAGSNPLVVTLLNVRKANAIIVQADGAVMVIDTGEEEDGGEVMEFLRGKGVSTVDALIITHFDHGHNFLSF